MAYVYVQYLACRDKQAQSLLRIIVVATLAHGSRGMGTYTTGEVKTSVQM